MQYTIRDTGEKHAQGWCLYELKAGDTLIAASLDHHEAYTILYRRTRPGDVLVHLNTAGAVTGRETAEAVWASHVKQEKRFGPTDWDAWLGRKHQGDTC